MRLVPPALLFLAVALACSGAPVASTVSTTIPADVTQGEDGQWPATPEGACARMSECGCSPVPSFTGCVAQHKLGMKAVDGVLQLQDAMIEVALAGEEGPEAEMMRSMTGLGTDLVTSGVDASLAMMATMECEPLCAEVAKMKDQASRGE